MPAFPLLPPAQAILGRVTPALEYGGFEQLDMVIEAVIEDLGLKQRIFADLERRAGGARERGERGDSPAVDALRFPWLWSV